MIRIVIDVEERGDILGVKEAIAVALEQVGDVRVVQVITGKEKK